MVYTVQRYGQRKDEGESVLKKIAIYGKGGIGKSTTAANIAAAMSREGLKVCQIGCDPKNDSTRLLLGKICPKTVLDMVRDCDDEDDITAKDIVHIGYNGIKCVEAGGPEPGVGCAGRGLCRTRDYRGIGKIAFARCAVR